jgi:hypothetical protein
MELDIVYAPYSGEIYERLQKTLQRLRAVKRTALHRVRLSRPYPLVLE